MKKYKCLISYDGTRYSGWQRQPNALSIQEHLESTFQLLLKEQIALTGAGRTDAGVHALNQVAHFECEKPLDTKKLLQSVNGILPHDIRVKSIEETDPIFHARYGALRKEYHYHLWLQPPIDPFLRLYRYSPPFALSIPILEEACKQFVGTRDFATFANLHGGAKTSVRTLYRLDLIPQNGGYRLEFEGDGFLYKMVRNIVGTLLEVSSSKRHLNAIAQLFSEKDRRSAGMAAPAKGLFLVKITY